jgi:hypothetical protein
VSPALHSAGRIRKKIAIDIVERKFMTRRVTSVFTLDPFCPFFAVCSCPERAQQTSPGQRPGKRKIACVLGLKGLNNAPARHLLRPFRAHILFNFFSQGLALGYIVPAFQAEDEDRKTIYGQDLRVDS